MLPDDLLKTKNFSLMIEGNGKSYKSTASVKLESLGRCEALHQWLRRIVRQGHCITGCAQPQFSAPLRGTSFDALEQ